MSAIENFLKAKFREVKFDYYESEMREITLKMKRAVEIGLGRRAEKKGERGLPMIDTHIVRPVKFPEISPRILAVEVGGRTLRIVVGFIKDKVVNIDYFNVSESPLGLKISPKELAQFIRPIIEEFNPTAGAISLALPQKVIINPGSGGLIDGIPLESGKLKGANLQSSMQPYGFEVKKALEMEDIKITVGNDAAFGAFGAWFTSGGPHDIVFEVKGTGTNYFIQGYNTEAKCFSEFPPQPLDWIPKELKKDPYLLEQYTAGRGFEQSIQKIARGFLFRGTPQRLARTLSELESETSIDRQKKPVTAKEIFVYLIQDNAEIDELIAQKKGFDGFLDEEELKGLKFIAKKIFERACKVNGIMWEALFETFEMGISKEKEVQIACDGALITKHGKYREGTIQFIKETAHIFGKERYAQYILPKKKIALAEAGEYLVGGKYLSKGEFEVRVEEEISWGLLGAFVLGAISVLSEENRRKALR